MYKTKRLLSNAEMEIFLKLREENNTKAAKYIKSLEKELFEIEDYDVINTGAIRSSNQRSRDFEVTED